MVLEMLVGLEVKDDKAYDEYRRLMTPLLKRYGGGFRYDFIVSSVLIPETIEYINRVFVIFFGSRDEKEGFFSHKEYLNIKKQYFDSSVGELIVLSEYEINSHQ